ncbi:Polyamine transport [Fusarium albosuccineum]|uniref:Polyamine transport n=1 Tax=Fusarium albosuccineum TaxID=1237068 RepID=A0A8H4PBP9_9HYPO|nr:Polyamine transport [Fusarium albosuccineum]
MFSTFFSHTQAQLPQGQSEMEMGDFDHTPAPSGRPSLEMPRDSSGQPDTTDEPRAAQGTGIRHHLLKTSARGPITVDKDYPIHPVLSPVSESQKTTLKPRDQGVQHESQRAFSTTTSPFKLPENGESSPSIPGVDRIRVEPFVPIHAHPHTPASAGATSSYGATEEGPDERSIWPASGGSPPDSFCPHTEADQNPQTFSVGGPHPAVKTREILYVKGNSRSIKVSPAFNHYQQHLGGSSEQKVCDVNKVRPCNPMLGFTKVPPEYSGSNNSEFMVEGCGMDDLGDLTRESKRALDTKPIEQQTRVPSKHSGTRFALKSRTSSLASSMNPPGRSQSLGSVLDYIRTKQWLKSIVSPSRSSRSYDPKFTGIPSRARSTKVSFVDSRRPSEPVLPSSIASRRLTGKTTLSSRSDPRIDGLMFKRAVSDLERLLNEALSLASQVADQSEAAVVADYSHHFIGVPNGRHSSSSSDRSMHSAQESINLSMKDVDYTPHPTRPQYRHAATDTYTSKRPRLADVVKTYSGMYQDIRTRIFGDQPHHEEVLELSQQYSPSQMASNQLGMGPRRRKLEADENLVSISPSIASISGPRGLKEQSPMQKRSAATNTTLARRNTTGQDVLPDRDIAGRKLHGEHGISLRKRSHSPIRKRFVASVACLSTALIGIILGIYTGLVPSIQYYIVDQSHVTVHGNTGCFLALALPSFFLWPLPLLHGRKPYIMSSLIIAMPLLFPQAIAVSSQRLTNTASWRALLIASRTLMGGSLGFASMNFHSVLTDLFGASLMCSHPHQEVVDHFDARRHGGGMGVWLSIWTWCWIGSLGLGFLIGASIIDKHPPAWGFYVSIMLIAIVLLLNVACPEVRRSAFRRSVAEVRAGETISRRLARGEVMMHRVKTGPKWWGEEVYHGICLSVEMLQQPGFTVMAVYVSWIYAQVVLVIILLGSLASRFYRLRSPYVGLHVAALTLGASFAIPFQKASIFSRSRHQRVNSSRETLDKKVAWSSHLVRRAIFTVSLPIGGACYAAVSSGPPINVGVPTFVALCIGFLSCLAVSECNGLVMETFDTSDLSPGMVGRHRDASGQDQRRTNYSSFPRVTAGFAVIHSFAFVLAAGSTALGGHITRKLGQQVTTGVVAGILFLLTVLLLLVLIRFKNILIIPRSKSEEMDRLTQARRRSTKRRASMPNDLRVMMEEDFAWRPVMIGNPMGKNRRMNVLEMGNMTRWQDIQRRNKLIDAGLHLNRDTLDQGLDALDAALENRVDDMRRDAHGLFKNGSIRRHGSRLRRSNQSSDQTFHEMELDMISPEATPGEPSQPRQFVERDCFLGQTVKEENEDEVRAGPAGH